LENELISENALSKMGNNKQTKSTVDGAASTICTKVLVEKIEMFI